MDDRRLSMLRWISGGVAALVWLATFASVYWRDDILRADMDPKQPFQTQTPPPAPDYNRDDAWALRGEAAFAAAPADIFFVHSTTYRGGRSWVGSIHDPESERALTAEVMPNYAGPFADLGRVFAPRYRQASLFAYRLTLREDARDARLFAFADVKSAFQHFVSKDSPERPIILAGVGQGAQMAERLAREAMNDPAILKRIAAVYLMDELIPAAAFPPESPLPLCSRRTQARCVVAWKQEGDGGPDRSHILARAMIWTASGELDHVKDLRPACVNPLTGVRDDAEGDADRSLGAANASGQGWNHTPVLIPQAVEARCVDGFLAVSTPAAANLRPTGNWMERLRAPPFNLFYADIAADARARLSAWYGGPLAQPIRTTIPVRASPVHRIGSGG